MDLARGALPTLVAVLALQLACAASAPPAAAPFIAYLPTEPATLNFVSENDRSTRVIGKLVCDTLVAFDRDLRLLPRLASSWETSADGRDVTFHLRRGVRWHDGAPFTAADVAFTLDRVLDPAALAAGKRVYFDTVASHEIIDELTFVVHRSEPYARAVEVFEGLPILPRHLLEGKDFLTSPHHRAPIGTGPYRLAAWEAGHRIELTANDDYFGGPPGLPRIIFRPLADASTRMEALLAGQLDLTSLRPLDVERIEADPGLSRRVRVLRQDTLYLWYIAWNLDGSNPFFGDARVRRAMTQALDRQGFVDTVLMGAGQVATSLVHPSMWAFDADLEPWPYDRAAAARLLEDAGWSDTDGDGLRQRLGEDFRFTLMVPAGNDELIRLAALLQESLRTLGVEMEIRTLEYNLYRRQRDQGQFHAMLGGWSLDPDPDCYDFWHSSQARGTGLNYASYANTEVDGMCSAARQLTDTAARTALYRRVQAILHEDQPNTFVAYRQSLTGLSRRLRGVEPSALGVWGWYPGPLRWTLGPGE